MATNVILPALGMSQDSGQIVQWLKARGDQVEQGEPIAEIQTDKATVELEAPASGTLARISAAGRRRGTGGARHRRHPVGRGSCRAAAGVTETVAAAAQEPSGRRGRMTEIADNGFVAPLAEVGSSRTASGIAKGPASGCRARGRPEAGRGFGTGRRRACRRCALSIEAEAASTGELRSSLASDG